MHDNFDDIDRQFRSMLEDAEVKAPRRNWRAISSRLDAAALPAASRSAAMSPWRWGLALAAAAALALAIVLPGNLNHPDPAAPSIALLDSPAAASSDALALAEPSTGPEQPSISEAAAPVRTSKSAAAKAQPAVGNTSPLQASSLDAAADETQTSVQPIEETVHPSGASSYSASGTDDASTRSAAAPAANSSAYAAQAATENARDYWAAVESSEPAASSRRPSLSFGGMVGTNDSGFAANHGRSMMSPSYGGQQKLEGLVETSSSAYGVPVTFGLGVRFPLAAKLSLGTGLTWSLLTRTFSGDYAEGGDVTKGDVTHQIQYLGVPVSVFYDIVNISTLKFYTYAGGEVSHAVSNKYLIRDISRTVSNPVDRFQFSVSAGLGIEFPLSGKLGLYLDPGVRYYFYSGQPKSLRTEKPFMVSVDAGLRFNL